MNVNGNWWIHIRGDGLHDHMREKIESSTSRNEWFIL